MGDPKLVEIPTPEQLAELERLDREATPGKWRSFDMDDAKGTYLAGLGSWMVTAGEVTLRNDESNARLIAAMRNALPSLLAAARRLGEVEAAMRDLVESGRRAEEERCAQLTTSNARAEALGAALLTLYEVVDDNRNHIDDRSTRRDVDDALKAAEAALDAAKVPR